MLLTFAFTLFLSATLMFFLELMVGKMMLPLLGGTPAVWNTCMVYYQAILLLGYAFAHWSTQWLGARGQARLQLTILIFPFFAIAINGLFYSGLLAPNEKLILGQEANPIPALLLVLSLSIGLPMFLICTVAPLLQRWFSSTDHPAASDPYFLYGASNFGSMLGLWGYIFLVEPYLTLKEQQLIWVVGLALLSLLIVACALLMWGSRPAGSLALAGLPNDVAIFHSNPGPASTKSASRKPNKPDLARASVPPLVEEENRPSTQPVTWARRFYWIALALVPSSLMLGTTTYITTDIASIPLLWVLPLTLYLLTFIIVFAKIAPLTQSIVTLASFAVLMGVTLVSILPKFVTEPSMLWLVRLIGLGVLAFSLQLLKVRDTKLIHRVMIMVMPLLVLLLIFMMLSDIRPGIVPNILLHLATMFIVAMVCHGELANDRPEPKHLTEFFLLMSTGGVLGGLFNALFAPVAFNSLVEYPLLLMVACLLLPPLGVGRASYWARLADLALAAVFLLVGGLLLYMRWRDEANRPNLQPLWEGPWQWGVAALVLGLLVGAVAAWRGWGGESRTSDDEPDHWLDRILDVVLPAALFLLVLGLFWGLPAKGVEGRITNFASMLKLEPRQFKVILIFGLPAVLCYTFVERSVRFGLGVGAILLAAGYSNYLEDPPIYQQRSFFGVLRVEDGGAMKEGYFYPFTRLVHGTTLHGKQFEIDGLRDLPSSYYHGSGPVGQIFRFYNVPRDGEDHLRPIAVIGLGTGTMACYVKPGQTLDFYDIDPVVVDISFDTRKYFSFVEDAENRGADVNLILGDARLTFQPTGDKVRLKPLRKSKDNPTPQRQYGKPLTDDYKYGFIVVDAFSSDAIPVHLITEQAVKIYMERLVEDGILLMHISNRHLDLQPVLANITDKLGLIGYHMSDGENDVVGKNSAHWVAIVRKKEYLSRVLEQKRWNVDEDELALMGAAITPYPGSIFPPVPGMVTSGLSQAFLTLTDQQEQMLAAAEGKTGDLSLVQLHWEPLDQPGALQAREQELAEQIEHLERRRQEVDRSLTEARDTAKRVSDKLQPEIDKLKEQIKKLDEDIDKEMKELGNVLTRGLKELNTKLADAEKKQLTLLEELVTLKAQQKEKPASDDSSVKALTSKIESIDKEVEELRTKTIPRLSKAIETLNAQAKRRLPPIENEVYFRQDNEDDARALTRWATLRSREFDTAFRELVRAKDISEEVGKEIEKSSKSLFDMELKRIPLADQQHKLQDQVDDATRSKRWLERVQRSLDNRQERLENTLRSIPEKQRIAKRVKVWTDDYSNLLSVFNW